MVLEPELENALGTDDGVGIRHQYTERDMYLLLPTSCIGCQEFQTATICQKCRKRLKNFQVKRCAQCALPIRPHEKNSLCLDCLRKRPIFNTTLCLDSYGGFLTEAIHSYKYQHQIAIAHGLLDAWLDIHPKEFLNSQAIDWILPIPMSQEKLHQRGFNQSWELCKLFSRKLKIKNSWKVLNRIHIEGDQVSANKQERAQRLNNVFSINPNNMDLIKNKNIVLIDDVMTTGATLSVIAQLLKDFGAQSVHNWVILRTPNKSPC
jgi:ComF family protein